MPEIIDLASALIACLQDVGQDPEGALVGIRAVASPSGGSGRLVKQPGVSVAFVPREQRLRQADQPGRVRGIVSWRDLSRRPQCLDRFCDDRRVRSSL